MFAFAFILPEMFQRQDGFLRDKQKIRSSKMRFTPQDLLRKKRHANTSVD